MSTDIQPTQPKALTTQELTTNAPANARVKSADSLLSVPTGSATADVVARQASPLDRNLEFSPDPSTGHMIIRVRSSATGEVIRQIPSEQAVELAKAINGMHGVFLADQA